MNSDEENEEVEVVTERQEDVVDDLSYDLFNLTASCYHPLRWSSENDREETIRNAATRAAQLLFKRYRT